MVPILSSGDCFVVGRRSYVRVARRHHSTFTLLGQDIQRPGSVELGVCELIAVTAEATVAARVAAAIALHAFRGGAKDIAEDLFVFQLRHQPGAARHAVVEHDRGLTWALAAGNRDVQVGVRNFQRVRRAEQDRVGDRVRIPLAMDHRELKAHDVGV